MHWEKTESPQVLFVLSGVLLWETPPASLWRSCVTETQATSALVMMRWWSYSAALISSVSFIFALWMTIKATTQCQLQQKGLSGRESLWSQNIQQGIQDREKALEAFQWEVEVINCSADKAVEDREKTFSELNRLMEKRRSDVKPYVRSQQTTELIRVKERQERLKQEITELRREDAALEQLSQTDDHNQFLKNCPSLRLLHDSIDSNSSNIYSLKHFRDVTATASKVRSQR